MNRLAGRLTAFLILLTVSMLSSAFAEGEDQIRPDPPLRSFDVKAVSTKAYFIDGGKVKEEEAGDQVVYFVDLPNKKVKRVAVYYAQKKKKKGEQVISSGLHAEPLDYAVVHYKFDFMRNQLLIKALAQTQNEDGFETLVIGEDFVASTVSTRGYFTVTYYDRTDDEAMIYKKREGKINTEDQGTGADEYSSEDESSAVEWFSGKIKKIKKIKPWHQPSAESTALGQRAEQESWPEPGEVVTQAEPTQVTSGDEGGFTGKLKSFNRWRRQKVRSSYTD